jgi:solute carrier family 12 sodium/potassium/chloride transporter 2
MNVGVAILRLQEGLDCSEILADIDDLILNSKLSKEQNSTSHQAYEWSVTSTGSNFSPNPSDSTSTRNLEIIRVIL